PDQDTDIKLPGGKKPGITLKDDGYPDFLDKATIDALKLDPSIFGPSNVNPLPIKPAPATFTTESLKLPGTIAHACLGGGGRFVILSIPSQRQIAILDVNERKIVKYLPLAGDNPVMTAGLEKLVVAYPQQNIIQRWNLLTFEKEATVTSPFT